MVAEKLVFLRNHLLLVLDEGRWLLDTGAPTSFGEGPCPLGPGDPFVVPPDCTGLTASKLSEFVGGACCGLLGADILNRFDHIFDIAGGTATISEDELDHPGKPIPIEEFMGIPIVSVRIGGAERRMFFDTGAQISYFQDDSLGGYQSAGTVSSIPASGRLRPRHTPSRLKSTASRSPFAAGACRACWHVADGRCGGDRR